MSFEPDRDRFFQYATFVTVGLTVLVCACYALLFLNPRVNPIAALRPETPTPDLRVAELPATWTPTFTSTATNTPTSTPTFTPTFTPTHTPTITLTPTFTPTPTTWFIVVPGNAPAPVATRAPIIAPPPQPTQPQPTRPPAQPTAPPSPTEVPAPQFEFRLGRPVDAAPNCGTWYVAGTVYSDASGANKLNGLLVRIWAAGIEQGTYTTGSNGNPGYWEWIFGNGTAAPGEVAIVNADGSQRSPRVPFQMTENCEGDGAVQQNLIDFVGN